MPPRPRPTPSDTFHGSFDPGVTGRRTGVAPPLNVRKTSNGIESFSDYFLSPRKDPSVSPITSPHRPNHGSKSNLVPQRARNDRPDLFHEIGERGRKTGISPPKNTTRDENGFEDFDDYLIKATEQTNKGIARERKRSLRRKSINQAALHARKLSVATFVDDGEDDDDEFLNESMSIVTPDFDSIRDRESQAGRYQSSRSIPSPIHSHSRNKSHEDQPITIQEDDDPDDTQDSAGMVGNEFDEPSVASDRSDPPPLPSPESVADQGPAGLEDIMEGDEDNQEPVASPSAQVDSAGQVKAAKRRKSTHPPPVTGIRRGQRQRFERLAHWRGERVVYGRSTSPDGTQRAIGMVDVVRVPPEPSISLAQRRGRGRGSSRIKSESIAPSHSGVPEEGWDSETRPNGIVYSYTKNKDCERTIVCTKRMVTLDVEDQAGVPNSFQFQRVFKDSDFIAGGLMYIPVGGCKPLKPAKDNFYFFTVLEGAVSVHVHRTKFVVAPSGVFLIPRGNVYSIQNISQRTAKLSFAQARRATGEDPDLDSDEVDEEHSITHANSNNPSTSTAQVASHRDGSHSDHDNDHLNQSNLRKTSKSKQRGHDANGESSNLPARRRGQPQRNTAKRKKNKAVEADPAPEQGQSDSDDEQTSQ